METSQNFSKDFELAEIELVYTPSYKVTDRPKITSPSESYRVLISAWNQSKIQLVEEFKILLLNRGNYVQGVYHVCTGGITSTPADIRLIFAAALKAGSTGMILAHNHPSGVLRPSEQDHQLTRRIKSIAQLMEIQILDHLILTAEGYYSFADDGLL